MNVSITINGNNADEVQHELIRLAAPLMAAQLSGKSAPVTASAGDKTAPVEAPEEATSDEPVAEDKPSVYRAKNAENIANAIIEKVASGAELDANDLDDIPRLPKKWQDEIEAAQQAGMASDTESAEEAATEPYSLTNGDDTEEYDTAAGWVEAMVEAINSTSDAAELKALADANRPVVQRLAGEVDDEEVLKPVADAYAERRAGFEETGAEEETAAEEPADEEKTAEPASEITAEDAREALKKLIKESGTGAAEKLLKQYNAGKISDIKPTEYQRFINDVEEQLSGNDLVA